MLLHIVIVLNVTQLTLMFCRHQMSVDLFSKCLGDFFRLDALAKALNVIATATWLGGGLGGWLAGWLGVRHTPVLYRNG